MVTEPARGVLGFRRLVHAGFIVPRRGGRLRPQLVVADLAVVLCGLHMSCVIEDYVAGFRLECQFVRCLLVLGGDAEPEQRYQQGREEQMCLRIVTLLRCDPGGRL